MDSCPRFLLVFFCLSSLITTISNPATGQTPNHPPVITIEITPAQTEYEVGQHVKFSAVAKDESGKPLNEKPARWRAMPFDAAAIDDSGNTDFYQPGEVTISVVIAGKPHITTILVKPAPVKTLMIDPPSPRIVVGGTIKLNATAHIFNGDPRTDVAISWASDNPSVATVDAAGVVAGVTPGTAILRAASGGANATISVVVAKNTLTGLTIEPATTSARTGDVVRFKAIPAGAPSEFAPRWALSGDGAAIDADGAFVAERPGTYLVSANIGNRSANASIVIRPRNVERELEVVGRAPLKDVQGAEEWIIGKYAYFSTIADSFFVYDISDPANPKLTDTVKVDARLINDISTTADGKILVISREEASNRKNGIAFYDTSDPAHPKPISEYTTTVTGGVHSAFVDGHYVYLTDDATGSTRVIDFANVKNPKEVARWQVDNQVATTMKTADGDTIQGRYLLELSINGLLPS
jgi:hypothetical protein